jgi:phytoene dehydrogenase-like protein
VTYDAAIIGAGANGLGAAAHLARAGLKVAVIERAARAGGRLETRQFRPGYCASPFLDSVPEIVPALREMLDIALRPLAPVADVPQAPTMPHVEAVTGGLGALADAFAKAAISSGVELRFGLPAVDVLVEKTLLRRKRVRGVLLADGSVIAAKAVISTLDLRQSMFSWRSMPAELADHVRAVHFAGRVARLLLALERPVGENAFALAADSEAMQAWRQNHLPDLPPLRFDPVSARDATLARGGAIATVTLDYIPTRLAEGAWTHRRRVDLAARALARLAPHLPGLLTALRAVEIIVPSDIEDALAASEGDLDGGISAGERAVGPRTALPGFYLGGIPASHLGTGAPGLAAALALLAD